MTYHEAERKQEACDLSYALAPLGDCRLSRYPVDGQSSGEGYPALTLIR